MHRQSITPAPRDFPNPSVRRGRPGVAVGCFKESASCDCGGGWHVGLSRNGQWIMAICKTCARVYLPRTPSDLLRRSVHRSVVIRRDEVEA